MEETFLENHPATGVASKGFARVICNLEKGQNFPRNVETLTMKFPASFVLISGFDPYIYSILRAFFYKSY